MKDSQDRATEVFSAGTRDSPQTGHHAMVDAAADRNRSRRRAEGVPDADHFELVGEPRHLVVV